MQLLKPFKIALVQIDSVIKDKNYNFDLMVKFLLESVENNTQLVVFPECSLTGYCYKSRKEALEVAEEIPGSSSKYFSEFCREKNIFMIYGLIEKDKDKLYNSAVLIGPSGIIGKHRKLHLPHLALDHHVDQGDLPIQVFKTPLANIGMGICYDLKFPEYSRMLALIGADLIVLPTNWPDPGKPITDPVLARARAIENKVYFAAVNRVGTERDYTFVGQSVVFDTRGNELAKGSPTEQEIIYATVNPKESRDKIIQRKPGFWMNYIDDRRPELYKSLSVLINKEFK